MCVAHYKLDLGRRWPNSTAQGAFLVTSFCNCEHHKAANVRQLFDPSRCSCLGKSANSHFRSQNLILEVVTPAFLLSSCMSVPVFICCRENTFLNIYYTFHTLIPVPAFLVITQNRVKKFSIQLLFILFDAFLNQMI